MSWLSVADAAVSPAISISPTTSSTSLLWVNETGTVSLIQVSLNVAPSLDISIPVVISDSSEVLTDVSSLTFTAINWQTPQYVLITGNDDAVVDGDQDSTVTLGPVAGISNYAGVSSSPVYIRNFDDETPTLVTSQVGGATTVLEGSSSTTATVQVKLGAQPSSNVTVSAVVVGNMVVTSTVPLTFSSVTWNTFQDIVVKANVNDAIVQGPRSASLNLIASGSGFSGVTASIAATVNDDDSAQCEITPISGLVTTEDGGQATASIRLTSQPTASVTIPLSSSDLTEGTVSPSSVTFTVSDWNTFKPITMTGVTDNLHDGSVPWLVVTGDVTSTDTNYDALTAANITDISVVNQDTDTANIVVTPGTLVVAESGPTNTATVTVTLSSDPLGSITVNADTVAHGIATILPSSVVLDSSNWSTGATFTVTGINNGVADSGGFQTTQADFSDAGAIFTTAHLTVTNQDDDSPALLIGQSGALTLTEGSLTTASYTINLSRAPAANVIVQPHADSQTTIIVGSTLTFTPSDWSTGKTITVQVVDDDIAEGNHTGLITHTVSSTDTDYDNLSAQASTVAITDNDTVGIIVTPINGLTTSEPAVSIAAGTATFSVRLRSKPVTSISVPIVSSDTSQGVVSSSTLVFTASDWNSTKSITITGADGNAQDDGNVPYTIQVGPITVGDANYIGVSGSDVSVTNVAINNLPTLASISDVTALENDNQQTVSLTGISDGQTGENQTLVVTATSDNMSLTGTPSITYTSPATTGQLLFTPVANQHGTALITVTVSEVLGTSVSKTFTVTVTHINQAPTVTRNVSLSVGYRATGYWSGYNSNASVHGQLSATDDDTVSTDLLYTVVLTPPGGDLYRSGVALAVNSTFTQADLDAGNVISYTHRGGGGTTDGFVVTISDDTSPSPGVTSSFLVPIDLDRSAPELDLLPSTAAAWTEGASPVSIAPDSTVVYSTHMSGGSLRVQFQSGSSAEDSLTIDGSLGQISVVNTHVFYLGNEIGTWTGGTTSNDLVVSFTSVHATALAVQSLARSILFSSGDNPGATSRVVGVTIADGIGHTGTTMTQSITVTPVNDAPVVIGNTLFTLPGIKVPGSVTGTDSEGSALTFSVVQSPGRGRLLDFQTTHVGGTYTYSFIYEPDDDADGNDSFTIAASDGVLTSTAATVSVSISGTSVANRLWIVGGPPLEAYVGDSITWTVSIDGAGLTSPGNLRMALEDAPSGVTVTVDNVNARATITWPVVSGSGHIRYKLRAWDISSSASDVQQVTVYVQASPMSGVAMERSNHMPAILLGLVAALNSLQCMVLGRKNYR